MLLKHVLISLLLTVASLAVPLRMEVGADIALREPLSNELVSRSPKFQIHHLPKVHLPHIDGHEVLDGLRKWAPKIGKTVFKIATKLILREEEAFIPPVRKRGLEPRLGANFDSASILAISERDLGGEEGIHELIARSHSPKKTLKKIYKAMKKVKKYAEKSAKKFLIAEGKVVAADAANLNAQMDNGDSNSDTVDVDSREVGLEAEYDVIVKELEGASIDVRELDLYLGALIRGLEKWMFEMQGDEWKLPVVLDLEPRL